MNLKPKNQTILVKLAIIISGGSGRMVVGSAVYAIQNLIATFRQLRQKIGDRIMKAALYARVSTDDKGQNPQVQLDQLRQFCKDAGWEIFQEYVDYASACDFMKRKEWTRLMKDASMRKFNVVLVWKLDRMCRSCIDGTKILETFRAYGIAFRSMTEQWIDTTTPWGEALYHISAAWAGLERNLITERVNAGLESARRHGTKSGKAIGRPRKNIDFKNVLEACRHNIGKGGLPNYSWAAAELTKTTGIRVTAGFVQHRLLAGAAEVEQTVQDLMEDTSKTPLQESTEKQLLPVESK